MVARDGFRGLPRVFLSLVGLGVWGYLVLVGLGG